MTLALEIVELNGYRMRCQCCGVRARAMITRIDSRHRRCRFKRCARHLRRFLEASMRRAA